MSSKVDASFRDAILKVRWNVNGNWFGVFWVEKKSVGGFVFKGEEKKWEIKLFVGSNEDASPVEASWNLGMWERGNLITELRYV